MKWVSHMLCLLVGGFFTWTGVVKIAAPVDFFQNVLNYQLIGADLSWWVAMFLPWLEVFAGLGLMLPATRKGGLFWLAGMLAVFIAALLSALMRGLDIDCGCTGGSGTSVTFALVRNGFLLAALAGVFFIDKLCLRKTS